MKKIAKLLTMLLAVAMMLTTMVVPAFADQSLTVAADTTNGSLTVNKYVVVDKDAPIPNETFTFTLTPVADTTGMTYDEQAIKSGIAVTSNSTTISFSNTSSTTAGSGTSNTDGITTTGTAQKYAQNTGTISLLGATFPAPGIYRYALKETAPDTKTAGMTYDASEFYVDVYVGYAENASVMSILAVKTTRYKSVNGQTEGAHAKGDQFVNTFGGGNLEISKTVTGNMGDHDKEFAFKLTVAANTQLTAGTTLTAVKTGETDPITVTVGTEYEFTLKHGETLTVKCLPLGTVYTVVEPSYAGDGYTTSVVTTENSVAADSVDTSTINNAIVAGGNKEAFTNKKDITTPTGILLEIAPFALIVLLAGTAGVVMIVKKRRNSSR